MKKVLLLAVAAVLMGSTFAHAEDYEQDPIYQEHQEMIIQTGELQQMSSMVSEISQLRQSIEKEGPRAEMLSEIEKQASAIYSTADGSENGNIIDQAYNHVSALKQQALSVVNK